MIEKLRELGYTAEPVYETADGTPVYRISGFGVSDVYVPDGSDVVEALADPEQHATRVFLHEHPEAAGILGRLQQHGVEFTIDAANRKVMVTKPGDTTATAHTFAQVKAYVEALPAHDPYAKIRQQVQDATSLPQMKAALGNLLDHLSAQQ